MGSGRGRLELERGGFSLGTVANPNGVRGGVLELEGGLLITPRG